MKNWTAGYVAEVGYTYGYYNELNPLRSVFPLLKSGFLPPDFHNACELGFGQGLSINLNAATQTINWYGTDFNPSQAAFAQGMSSFAGSDAKLYDQSFEQFSQRDDLPEFDFIGLHGIWSWISDANRQILVDFIAKKLRVGGVLYISYNTQPGWAPMVPMRELLNAHARTQSSPSLPITERIDSALEFAQSMINLNPIFTKANPIIVEKIKSLQKQNKHYLAHEYFNLDWHPMSFGEMARWLEPAKVEFACSAHILDHVEAINLTPEQQAFLRTLPSGSFKEMAKDFMTNQQFRKDYWIKGPVRIKGTRQANLLSEQRFILVQMPDDIKFSVAGSLGEAELNADIYKPLIAYLSDFKPKALNEIAQAHPQIPLAQLLQAITVLIGKGVISHYVEPSTQVKKRSKSLNNYLFELAHSQDEVGFVSSAISGSVGLSRIQQLFVSAYLKGQKTPEEWANYAWSIFQQQGQKLVQEGRVLETDDDNLNELLTQAQSFKQQMPLLKALGLV
ncbi:MAG: class I SAM-dependent methyltransferase [Thiomicrospira sp.]